MAAANPKDQFANYAIVSVNESAANTLTFKKLETGISLTEKVAWVLNRLEYLISDLSATSFSGDSDLLRFGLSVSNTFSSALLTEVTIIDHNVVQRLDFGVAASMIQVRQPLIKDFSSMPAGGIIVPPVPLYLFAQGTGLAIASAVVVRIHYTLLTLSVDQYWELVEARRVLSS